jgi:hypothetical protein
MKTILQPDVVPGKPKAGFPKKYLRWMIAAAFIGGGFFTAYMLINKSVTNKQGDGKHVSKKATTDTPPSIMYVPQKEIVSENPIAGKNSVDISTTHQSKKPAPVQIIHPSPAKTKPETIHIDLQDDSKSGQVTINEKATLEKFFKQLEKQSQQFVINNKRDTLITGEDGTALLIPANTFDSKDEVVISMKEFYSYEDIITNKLSTCSNGQQLITGGMIHIIATVNGKEVNIQPGKSIRWFVPDTTTAINQMQLFTGSTAQTNRLTESIDGEQLRNFFNRTGTDTIGRSESLETVNWIPQYQYFSTDYLATAVKVLYLPNEPFKTRQTRKGDIGFFHIADKPKISREELETELKEKYGYYKVKMRKPKKDNLFTRMFFGYRRLQLLESSAAVGDSAWIKDDIAKMYRLKASDTITSVRRNINYTEFGYNRKRTFANINLNDLAKRFSVDIRTLGWINCDRFINNGQPKIDYYVDLKDTATNYYTLLVFDKIRSMMTGYTNGNKIVFSNVPEGESAKVISVGIQNGKTVAAMEKVRISKTPLISLKFEDTSPTAFKEEVKGFDK